MSETEKLNYEKIRLNKLVKTTEKINIRLNLEKASMEQKKTTKFNEFKKTRAIAFDNFVQKYKNKHNMLENSQNHEMSKNKTNQVKSNITKSNSMTSNILIIIKFFLESGILIKKQNVY